MINRGRLLNPVKIRWSIMECLGSMAAYFNIYTELHTRWSQSRSSLDRINQGVAQEKHTKYRAGVTLFEAWRLTQMRTEKVETLASIKSLSLS